MNTEIPPFVEASASNLEKPVVDNFASRLAEKLGYKSANDLEMIVQNLGGEIRYDDGGSGDSGGSLEVYPGQFPRFLIRLCSFVGNLRNRFTIAHELGHYYLHSDAGKKPIRVARAGTNRVEWEANWFAGAFLLPASRFREDWDAFGQDTARLAAKYQISEAVVEIRVETLGLKHG